MRRLIPICTILAAALLLATIAAAQTTSVSGQIIAPDGAPWVDVEVIIQNTSTGQKFDTKTDDHGKYTQLGMPPGSYKVTIFDKRSNGFTYSEPHTFHGGQDNDVSIDFKKLIESAHPEAQKKGEEEKNKQTSLKAHFDAGVTAMNDSNTLRAQLATTPAPDKGPVQDKLNADYKTAIGEFQQAQQADAPTDVKNQAVIWANLGEAYEYAGQYDDAINAYQKAIDAQPQPVYYINMSKDIANEAAALTDPAAAAQKLADAIAACDKATALDPTANAGMCYKNIGVILSNKGDMRDAIAPLQKATQSNPKDAEAWFLLGSALTATAETKQEGDQMVTVFPPGTAEAFQKCMAADPNGPYASQAKDVLDGMASMGAGIKTTVEKKKK
jgi:tetratricopeptide (TPR) repeat protein